MSFCIIPHQPPRSATTSKLSLVNIGLYALSRGEWPMVMAITRLIERRAMRHV
jgi:hypothetical protein